MLRGDPANALRLVFVPGDLLALAAMVAWSLYSVLLRHSKTTLDPTTRLAAICAGGLVANLPVVAAETALVGMPAFD